MKSAKALQNSVHDVKTWLLPKLGVSTTIVWSCRLAIFSFIFLCFVFLYRACLASFVSFGATRPETRPTKRLGARPDSPTVWRRASRRRALARSHVCPSTPTTAKSSSSSPFTSQLVVRGIQAGRSVFTEVEVVADDTSPSSQSSSSTTARNFRRFAAGKTFELDDSSDDVGSFSGSNSDVDDIDLVCRTGQSSQKGWKRMSNGKKHTWGRGSRLGQVATHVRGDRSQRASGWDRS
jgi:hypothetical protein